ncbi:hypothetical protein [Streptomyces sp. Wb2n-11]|uniref:hypothetical protein n=1 Tax=Streptomyces sp. Wb2n-11 TaxID=1030533 RepID=UPI000AAAC3C0|nr:hypothetical protein [Streptomyces sp. Wb2n-11]
MTAMSAEERGDLAQALLPEAAGLVCAVREERPEQIAARLRGLSRYELEALAVVLAAIVDPDRGLKEALSWVDFDEYGEPTKYRPSTRRTVREAAPDVAPRGRGVDRVAVERALRGGQVNLNAAERSMAVDIGLRRGMSYDDVAAALRMDREAVKRSWERSKTRARKEGRWVPPMQVGEISGVA